MADQTDGIRLGLDLGGTKIEAVVLGGDGAQLARQRTAMPSDDYDQMLDAIRGLCGDVERMAGVVAAGVGVGTPGSIQPGTGLMRNASATPINGRPLASDLEKLLNRPVCLGNDANCFALAEAVSGAGTGHRTVFGAIIGTGVGGGVVIDGKVLLGRNLIGGEWGHIALAVQSREDLPGPLCGCGRHGCIQAWCSGPALSADHFRRTGAELDAGMLAAFAEAGDFEAKETLESHAARLGLALAGVVNLLDPDVIVLGGGLSKMRHLYETLPDRMRPHIFSDTFATPIVENKLGDSAGVIGAAWLA